MHPVFIQAIYYSILMVLTVGMMGFVLKGFFWKYIKVRMSFGKFILIKVRAINRNYFAVGKIDEGHLVYKHKKAEKMLTLSNSAGAFYRCLSVSWINVDEQKNCIISPTGEEVEGFDAVKMNNLYVRALYQPQLNDNREKLMFGLLVIVAIGVAVSLILAWQNYAYISQMVRGVGTVVPAVI